MLQNEVYKCEHCIHIVFGSYLVILVNYVDLILFFYLQICFQ